MHVKSIAECSTWSILQFFRPSLSYQLLLRSLFCIFLSGRFTQVLLYIIAKITIMIVIRFSNKISAHFEVEEINTK